MALGLPIKGVGLGNASLAWHVDRLDFIALLRYTTLDTHRLHTAPPLPPHHAHSLPQLYTLSASVLPLITVSCALAPAHKLRRPPAPLFLAPRRPRRALALHPLAACRPGLERPEAFELEAVRRVHPLGGLGQEEEGVLLPHGIQRGARVHVSQLQRREEMRDFRRGPGPEEHGGPVVEPWRERLEARRHLAIRVED